MDIEQAKLSDEEQDNCTPTDNEIQKHLNDKGILPERIKDPEKRKLLIAAILYGENICNAQIAKVLRLLVEKAGETPQLVKTEPVDFGDLDSFFERGAEAQLEADNAHYRPIIGALKAEIERLQVKVEKLNGMLLTKDEVVCITSDECNGCPTFENNQLLGLCQSCSIGIALREKALAKLQQQEQETEK